MKKSFNMPLTVVICFAAVFAGFSVTALADEPPRYKVDLEARAAEYTTLYYGVGRGEAKIDVYGYIVPADTGNTNPSYTDPPTSDSTISAGTTNPTDSSNTTTAATASTSNTSVPEPGSTISASTDITDSTPATSDDDDNKYNPTQPTGGIFVPDFSGDDIYVDQPSVTATSRILLNNGWFAEDMGNDLYLIYDENGTPLGYIQLPDGMNIEDCDIDYIIANLIPLSSDNPPPTSNTNKPNPGTSAGTGDNIRLYTGMFVLFMIFAVITLKVSKVKNNSPD